MKWTMVALAVLAMTVGAQAKPMHCTVTMKGKVLADEPCDVVGKVEPKGSQTAKFKSGTELYFQMRADKTAFVSFGENLSDILEWKHGCWRDDEAAQLTVCYSKEKR